MLSHSHADLRAPKTTFDLYIQNLRDGPCRQETKTTHCARPAQPILGGRYAYITNHYYMFTYSETFHICTLVDANKFGAAYLQKLGWSAGSGLGASGDGRTTHIKVHQKLDMLGIGAAHQRDPNGIAWKQNKDFENLLKRLNASGEDGEQIEVSKIDGFSKATETQEGTTAEATKREENKEPRKKRKREREGGRPEDENSSRNDNDSESEEVTKKKKKTTKKSKDKITTKIDSNPESLAVPEDSQSAPVVPRP
jgi:Pin2-interacting protein X1